jgi:hypothetical protein
MRETGAETMTIPFEKQVVFGTMGVIVLVAFWISPELGLLALGGVIPLSIISSLYWLLTSRKKRASRF